jgi:hypothetical protein
MPYCVAILRPTLAPDSEQFNAPILAQDCLGIEVTEHELAERCRLGNVDPQHLGGNSQVSAIEASLEVTLPPEGAVLVTIRQDADACGAMAVLRLRAARRAFPPEALDRIRLIGKSDRFDHGAWPGPRRLPENATEIDEVGVGAQQVGALKAAILCQDTSTEDAVELAADWVLTGRIPAAWVAAAGRAAEALFDAISSGAVVVRPTRHPIIALVEGIAPGALRLGYRLAPVVIGEEAMPGEPDRRRKLSIAQYESGWFDLRAVARDLSADEPGWGGSDNIIGSPQGRGSSLPIERCIDALLNRGVRCLITSTNRGA